MPEIIHDIDADPAQRDSLSVEFGENRHTCYIRRSEMIPPGRTG